jgi:hypothetical protein
MKFLDAEPSKLKRAKRKPLRTTEEMASEFGVPAASLRAKLGHDVDSPKPKLDNRNRCTGAGRRVWYDQDEIRAWWMRSNVEVSGRGFSRSA